MKPLRTLLGKDCEHRHSEGARVNPRDCRYWLNGNCLNLKCSFRHPSPGGLIGIPGASSLPTLPSPTMATPRISVQHSSTSHNPKKQSVDCYFFQKEQCLKGDNCPFVHGPQSIGLGPTGTPFPQQVIKVTACVAEPQCVPTNGPVDGRVMVGKRLAHREESPNEADKSDLRYRLLKQRRLHGRRSVVRLDCRGEPHSKEDHCHEADKYCSHHSSKYIQFPARNSPDRQRHRERHNGRLTLARPTLYQERHIDTMKRKLPDDFAVDAKSMKSHPVRRLDSNHLNFASPKSLAELKGAKVLDTFQKQSNKSINSRLALQQTSPIPPKEVLNLESMSPLQNGVLCRNGNGIDAAVCKKGLVPEGSMDDQSSLKDSVETHEKDVLRMENENEDLENPEEAFEGEDLEAEEDAYEDDNGELDFAAKVALLFS